MDTGENSMNNNMTAEQLAELFHSTYEALAPRYGYETRPGTAKPWSEIPEDSNNKQLMIAVAREVLQAQRGDKHGNDEGINSRRFARTWLEQNGLFDKDSDYDGWLGEK